MRTKCVIENLFPNKTPWGSLHVGAMSLEYNIWKGLFFPFIPPLSLLPVGTISHRCDKCQKAFNILSVYMTGLNFPQRAKTVPMETEIQSEPSGAWAQLIMVLSFWTSQSCHPKVCSLCRVATLRFGSLNDVNPDVFVSLKLLIAKVLCQYITFNVLCLP